MKALCVRNLLFRAVLSVTVVVTSCRGLDWAEDFLDYFNIDKDMYFGNEKWEYYNRIASPETDPEKVTVELYYETECPSCIEFYANHLRPLAKYLTGSLNVITYPFGKAKIIKQTNGSVSFVCQHGEYECYGNKLHGCVLKYFKDDHDLAIDFNGCMMNGKGSNDEGADECAAWGHIDLKLVENVKKCAKSNEADELMLHYGELSKQAGFKYVPYILINGKSWMDNDFGKFYKAVCAAFKNPPKKCENFGRK